MAWMIISDDSPDGPALRADSELMGAHWAYELSINDKILAAGSLRTDEGETPTGSLLVLDVDIREQALALMIADPATKAGLRTNVSIRFSNRAVLGGVEVAGTGGRRPGSAIRRARKFGNSFNNLPQSNAQSNAGSPTSS